MKNVFKKFEIEVISFDNNQIISTSGTEPVDPSKNSFGSQFLKNEGYKL